MVSVPASAYVFPTGVGMSRRQNCLSRSRDRFPYRRRDEPESAPA